MTDERLTIADLARALFPDMDRSLIQRYDRNPDAQELLGKREGTYPAESLHWWRHIAEARAQKPPLVRPETAGVFLRGVMENPPISDNRLAVIDVLAQENLPALLERKADDATAFLQNLTILPELADDIRELLKMLIPPADDELLTLAEAKRRTGVPLRVLRELPRQWGKVSMQDIQQRIRDEKQRGIETG